MDLKTLTFDTTNKFLLGNVEYRVPASALVCISKATQQVCAKIKASPVLNEPLEETSENTDFSRRGSNVVFQNVLLSHTQVLQIVDFHSKQTVPNLAISENFVVTGELVIAPARNNPHIKQFQILEETFEVHPRLYVRENSVRNFTCYEIFCDQVLRMSISPRGQLLNHKNRPMDLTITQFLDMLKNAHFDGTDVSYANSRDQKQLLLPVMRRGFLLDVWAQIAEKFNAVEKFSNHQIVL